MDWDEIEQTKIQNRLRYLDKRSHKKYRKEPDDYEDSEHIRRFKMKKIKHGIENE